MIKQGGQSYCFLPGIAKDFHVCAVPVAVQNEVIHHQHLVDRAFPAGTNTESQRGFIRHVLCLVVCVQRDFAFAALFEIL